MATHTPVQNGQLMSSPTVFWAPVPRTSSFSSAGPAVPWYRVNGAHSGLVTGSLASSLLSLWVAAADSATWRRSKPLLAPDTGKVQGFNHLDKADTFEVHRAVKDADPLDYSALVLPGGVANADQLRTVPAAVMLAQRIFEMDRPAAVICHGPWLLVDADLVRGRTLTSWPSLAADIRNAGGNWVDAEVQVCANGRTRW